MATAQQRFFEKTGQGQGTGTLESSQSEILDRQPPCNLDAERGVLGSILLLPETCDEIALMLDPADFHDDAHQQIFSQMVEMNDAGERIDSTLLVNHLKIAGHYERIGGAAYLAVLTRSVPHAAHAKYYANIVREKAKLRNLIHASTEILQEAYDQSLDSQELLGRAESKIFSILEGKGLTDVPALSEILGEAMERIDARMQKDHTLGGVDTGFPDLDNLLGGFHKEELLILASRPSMGKTALALNIASNVSMQHKVATLFVSLEMSGIELVDRLLCSVAKVDSKRMRNGTLSKEDRHKLVQQAGSISQAPLFIDDSPSRTMTEIAATARRLKRKNDLGLLVIDYLQLVEPDNLRDPRQEQIAKIARRLKGLARELKLPVLCLAQLNRQVEMAKDNRPRLSHLRESGSIEQDADVVMFVHRDEAYRSPAELENMPEDEKSQIVGQADIIVAKQRNGPTGDIKLIWLKEFTRFESSSQQPYDEFDTYNARVDF